MKAILKVKGGFTRNVDVPDPPPYKWYMAEYEDTSGDGLSDVLRQRTFIRTAIIDPEEGFRMTIGQSRYSHTVDYLNSVRDEIMRRHYQNYGVYDPVAIYEEEFRFTREQILEKAWEIATQNGWLSEVPVEPDNKRFINLDNEHQDL